MKQIRKLVYIILAVLLVACGIVKPIQETPTALLERTSLVPTSKLQITYLEHKNNFTEIFAVDILCIESDYLCFGEPMLLFKTMPASSDDFKKPKGIVDSYSWSPGGDKIVLSASGDMFIGDMNAQTWTNITNSAETNEYNPKWSSDGKYIYYLSCSRELGYGYCRLDCFTPAGEDKIDLLNLVDKSIDYFTVSPDNRTVVFSVSNDGFYHLYQSNLDGSEIRPITTAELDEKYPALEETYPSFSPDGNRFVFMRAYYSLPVGVSKEIVDLIIRDLNSSTEKNLTKGLENEVFSPVFSPEGKWIVFNAYDANLNSNIMVASIDGKTIVQVTQGIVDKGAPSWRLVRNQ